MRFKAGDKVRINRQATIDDFTKNCWNGCQIDTLDFIKRYANREKIFTIVEATTEYLRLENYVDAININIFELVEKASKKVTMKEVCEKFGYDVEIVKEEE